MKIKHAPRGYGKTKYLIRRADDRNGYIVCRSKKEADRIAYHAREGGYNINYPIRYDEVDRLVRKIHPDTPLFIDDVNLFLSHITRGRAEVGTISTDYVSDLFSIEDEVIHTNEEE